MEHYEQLYFTKVLGRRTSGPDPRERWPARLVATAAETRLDISPARAFERIID